jgi:hypothetical protein
MIPLREEMAGKTGTALTLCGLAIGLGLAATASRLLTTLLYGFSPRLHRDCRRGVVDSGGGSKAGMFRSGAPRLAHRSDDCPAAGMNLFAIDVVYRHQWPLAPLTSSPERWIY